MQFNWPILKDKLALQLGFVALLIYICLLPFQPFFPPITSGIVSFWLVYVLSFKANRLAGLKSNWFAHLFIAYYLILLAGLIYTANQPEARLDLTLKITLILWPLGMATWPELFNTHRQQIYKTFAIVTSLSAFVLIVIALYNWNDSGETIDKIYKYTSAWTWIPNHYIALYASFSLILIIDLRANKLIPNWLVIICSVALLILLLLTSVRIQFVALPLALATYLLYTSGKKSALLKWVPIIAILLIALAFLFPSSRNRINETFDEIKSINSMVNNKQTNHRVFIWRYGAEVVQENFFLGTGTGSGDEALNEKLKKCDAEFWNGKRTYTLREKNYNYHNAFLQHFATHGIIGFIIFVLIFIGPFVYYRNNLNPLAASFLVLSAIAFLTESMLERQAGVLFFSFFYSLFFVARVPPRA